MICMSYRGRDTEIRVVSELSNPVLPMDGVEVRRADYVFRGPRPDPCIIVVILIAVTITTCSKEPGHPCTCRPTCNLSAVIGNRYSPSVCVGNWNATSDYSRFLCIVYLTVTLWDMVAPWLSR